MRISQTGIARLAGSGPTRRARTLLSASLAVPILCAACGDRNGATPTSPTTVAGFVTGEATNHIGADGRFVFSAPTSASQPEISEPQAEAIAALWPKQFGSLVRGSIERDRGGPVHLNALQPCSRTLYASTSFEPLGADVPIGQRRAFGAWWLVPLCAGGQVEVTLAVSAYDTDLEIRNDTISTRTGGGMWFWWKGRPAGWTDAVRVSPEAAAAAVARLTGRQITEVPELITPIWRDGAPTESRWRAVTDAPAHVRGISDGRASAETELFVDAEPTTGRLRISRASSTQPPQTIQYRAARPVGRSTVGTTGMSASLARRPNYPIAFEAVAATGGD